MVMTRIELFDEITFEECDKIIVDMDKKICSMENNLCYKIAIYLKQKYNIENGIKISIKKNIPDSWSIPRAPAIIALSVVWASGVLKTSQMILLCSQGDEPEK